MDPITLLKLLAGNAQGGGTPGLASDPGMGGAPSPLNYQSQASPLMSTLMQPQGPVFNPGGGVGAGMGLFTPQINTRTMQANPGNQSLDNGPDIQATLRALDQAGELQKKALAQTGKSKDLGTAPRPGMAGLVLLADALFNHGRGTMANNFFQSFANTRTGLNQKSQQDANLQGQIQQVDAETAQKKAAYMQQQYNQDRTYNLQKATLNQKSDYQAGLEADRQSREADKVSNQVSTAFGKMQDRYNAANTPQEKIAMARAMRTFADKNKLPPEYAPTEDEANQDAAALDAKNKEGATEEWLKTKQGLKLNGFGEVNDQDAKDYNGAKAAIATRWGVDPASLPDVRTGKTAQKQYQDARIAQMKVNEADKVQFDKQRIANGGAAIDLTRQRFEYAKSQGDAKTQADIAKQGLAQSKAHNGYINDQIKSLSNQVKGLQTVYQASEREMTMTPAKGAAIDKNISNLQLQMKTLRDQLVDPKAFQSPTIVSGDNQPVNPLSGPIGASLRPIPHKGTSVRGSRTGAVFQFK